ncbi:MAG TPA: response regulator [Verrucomicrobiae bacterium]|jgi:DNA-binding response OmpR family regulator|nr:response regulator [Verrucomicrobiae bacterium]
MNILVIEDHPVQRKLAHHVLKFAGHQISEAGGAESAMASILRDRPEVILLDLALPGTDGLTLVRQLRAEAATRRIPIIAITSFPELFPEALALAAGCDSYFVKPINVRDLPNQIVAAASGKSDGSHAP